jgi:hypothetical protein
VDDSQLPLDSELFVASQPISGSLADPWSELTQPEAAHRYRGQVRRIIRQLRAELKREVKLAERSIHRHGTLEPAVLAQCGRLSPLGCYIAAQRMGRPDLARRFVAAAARQHHSCPLYQAASAWLLPAELYPFDECAGDKEAVHGARTPKRSIALN